MRPRKWIQLKPISCPHELWEGDAKIAKMFPKTAVDRGIMKTGEKL